MCCIRDPGRDSTCCCGISSSLSASGDAGIIARNPLSEITRLFSPKIKRKLKAAEIETSGLRMIGITPIGQRSPRPATHRGDSLALDAPLGWDHFCAIGADDDAFRDLICAAARRAFGQIGQEWGLPAVRLCGFVQEVATEPDVLEWIHASRRAPGSR